MKVTSKNGLKMEIEPRNPWNPLDWIYVLHQVYVIRNKDIKVNTDGWKMT